MCRQAVAEEAECGGQLSPPAYGNHHCGLQQQRAVASHLGGNQLRGRGNTVAGGLGAEGDEIQTAGLDM